MFLFLHASAYFRIGSGTSARPDRLSALPCKLDRFLADTSLSVDFDVSRFFSIKFSTFHPDRFTVDTAFSTSTVFCKGGDLAYSQLFKFGRIA